MTLEKAQADALVELLNVDPTVFKDLPAFIAEFRAWRDGQSRAESEQKRLDNRPPWLNGGNGDGLNRTDKREISRHVAQVIGATLLKDYRRYEALTEQYPDWYKEKAAFSEAANGEGLYLAPSVWSDRIYANVEQFGYARRMATVIPMPDRDIKLNAGTGAVLATWPGHNTAVTPTDATNFFTQSSLTAATLAVAAIIQKELDEDAIASLIDFLTMRHGKAIAKAEDLQFFNGTGSPFTGVVGAVTTNVVTLSATKTAFSNISWTDMVDLKLKTNPDIQINGAYVVSSTVFGVLSKEVDDNRRPIYFNEQPHANLNNTGINQTPWNYNGSPLWVVSNDLMPTTAAARVGAVFGDFENYSLFGERRGLTMETYDQSYAGVDLSGKRQVAIEMTERVALAFPDETAFAVLKTAAS